MRITKLGVTNRKYHLLVTKGAHEYAKCNSVGHKMLSHNFTDEQLREALRSGRFCKFCAPKANAILAVSEDHIEEIVADILSNNDEIRTVQMLRKERLIKLLDDHKCWPSYSDRPSVHYGDYDDSYDELTNTYLGIGWEDGDGSLLPEIQHTDVHPIPRYAATVHDETYNMVKLFDNVSEAARYSMGDGDQDTLNASGRVFDLDEEYPGVVSVRYVAMSEDAFAIISGVVAPSSENINVDGIYADAWQEVQKTFPVEAFRKWADVRDPLGDRDYYDQFAGE